jgi:type II secretory pathway component PulM
MKNINTKLPPPEALMALDHPTARKFEKFWNTYLNDHQGMNAWIQDNPEEAQELRDFVQEFQGQYNQIKNNE